MKAAYLPSSDLNAGGPQSTFALVANAGLIRDHLVHGENIGQGKRGASRDKALSYPSLGQACVPDEHLPLPYLNWCFLGRFLREEIGRKDFHRVRRRLLSPLWRSHPVCRRFLVSLNSCDVRQQSMNIETEIEIEFRPIQHAVTD